MAAGTSFHWMTPDNLKIYAIDWPVGEPRAVVGIVHGLGEHVHRYEHLVRFLHQHDIAVVGYDRRGHGRSEGQKGHTASFDAFLDEIAHLQQEIEQRYPGAPIFLYGHSMGGNLVLNYLIQRQPKLTGAIATGPHIRLAFQPSAIMVGLGKLMRNLVPGFTQPNGLAVDQLSRDVAVVKAYQDDPHVHDKLSARAGMAMLDAAAHLDTYKGELPTAVLLMHGEKDGITSAKGTQDFAARITSDITLKVWDGLFHEIHNEPEQGKVFETALQWLESKL